MPDGLLLVVTAVSVVVAVAMAVVAWRVRHEEQRRSNARVAALSAEVYADAAPPERGLGMSAVRTPAAPRPDTPRLVRSAAAAAAAPLYIRQPETPDLQLQPITASGPGLFAPPEPVRAGSRLATVVAIGVFVVGVAGALAVVLSGGSRSGVPAERSAGAAVAASAPPAVAPPLELVSLTHEREADRLMVRGIVRNPISAKTVGGLSAVVSAFNRDGAPVGTGRAVLDVPTLAPGAESAFVVPLAASASVERYRISFRTDAGVVAHVDRRPSDIRR